MNDKVKKILFIGVGVLLVAFIIFVLCIFFGYNRKLANLERTLTSSRDTTIELGERVRQQESLIDAITNRQSELEDLAGRLTTELRETRDIANRSANSLNALIGVEQEIDGYTGAVRGTIDQVIRSIDVTLQGIELEGITE